MLKPWLNWRIMILDYILMLEVSQQLFLTLHWVILFFDHLFDWLWWFSNIQHLHRRQISIIWYFFYIWIWILTICSSLTQVKTWRWENTRTKVGLDSKHEAEMQLFPDTKESTSTNYTYTRKLLQRKNTWKIVWKIYLENSDVCNNLSSWPVMLH